MTGHGKVAIGTPDMNQIAKEREMGRHERHDDVESQWPDENLLSTDHWPAPHDGKHRREDSGEEDTL